MARCRDWWASFKQDFCSHDWRFESDYDRELYWKGQFTGPLARCQKCGLHERIEDMEVGSPHRPYVFKGIEPIYADPLAKGKTDE